MIPKTGFFSQILLPVMIYLFNYTEYQFFLSTVLWFQAGKCHLFCLPCEFYDIFNIFLVVQVLCSVNCFQLIEYLTFFTFDKYSEHLRFLKLINTLPYLRRWSWNIPNKIKRDGAWKGKKEYIFWQIPYFSGI